MAMTAKKKARLKEQGLVEKKEPACSHKHVKICTCLVAVRGRGQHAIGCALYFE